MIYYIQIFFPEIISLFLAITILISGVIKRKILEFNLKSSLLLFLLCSAYYVFNFNDFEASIFDHSYIITNKTYIVKSIILSLSIIYFGSLYIYRQVNNMYEFEYFFIIFISLIGCLVSVSSNNFMLLYLSLEIISLSSYILTAYNKKNTSSSIAGIKYLTLSSIFTAISLFGLSLLYGATGSLDFNILNIYNTENQIFLSLGISLFILGVVFKIGIAPLHFWISDTYYGAPIMSIAIFSSIYKIPIFYVLISIITNMNDHILGLIIPAIKLCAILSIIIGSIGAIIQTSIKRIIGYSTILNNGYILSCLSVNNIMFNEAIIYLSVYGLSIIGLFTLLYILIGKKIEDIELKDLYNIKKNFISLGIVIIICSILGLPPLIGFFTKYIIFIGLIKQQAYLIFVTMLLGTVISAGYYLKIISSIYFYNQENQISYSTPNKINNIGYFIAFSILFLIITGPFLIKLYY